MNEYYNFICTSEGYEVRYKSNNELMGFFNIHEHEGFVCKNYVDSVSYRWVGKWLKGLEIHRDVKVVEQDFQ